MVITKTENILRIINIGDIHFRKEKANILYKELNEIFIKYIKEHKDEIDVINILGDLFDEEISMNKDTSKYIYNFINRLVNICKINNIKLRIIRGTRSHDLNQLENFNYFKTMKNLDFKIINTVEVEEIFDSINVLYLPEEYMEDQKEFYQPYFEGLVDGAKYDFIFGHGTFDVVAFVNQISESERTIKNAPVYNFDEYREYVYGPIIFGHIHPYQNFKDKLYYTGSFSRWAHGENLSKGFLDLTYDCETLEYTVKRIINTLAPEYVSLTLNEVKGKTIEEKLKEINRLSKDKFVKIIANESSLDNNIIKESLNLVNNDKVKLNLVNKELLDKEEDEEYMFIVKREYDIPTTIQKFIQLNMGKTVKKSDIEDILNKIDSDDD